MQGKGSYLKRTWCCFKDNVLFFSLLLVLLGSSSNNRNGRMFFCNGFLPEHIGRIDKVYIHFNDTLSNDTLYICFSRANLPVAVYREIHTGVCADGICKLINIRIYWTITGRYLGYVLPDEQELTKKKHVTFSGADYGILHNLLADSLSLLANYTLADILPKNTDTLTVDAVSGATVPDLTPYIVADAAYTSHTVWHLVYGSSRDSLNKVVQSFITISLLDSLINSKNAYDLLWAINNAAIIGQPTEKYIPYALQMLENGNYIIVKGALNFLDNNLPYSETYQAALLNLLLRSNFDTKRLAIERIQKFDTLNMLSAQILIQNLPVESPYVVKALLSVLGKKYVPSGNDIRSISNLLDSSNKQVAKSTYNYLVNLKKSNPWLKKRLDQFKKINSTL